MTFNRKDWSRLRNPLLGLGFVLVLVGLLAYYSSTYHSKQEAALNAQQTALNQARQKYLSSGQEREMIVKYLPIYQSLIRSGFVGEEQRIEWIEKLRQIHLQNKLFSIEYHIGQQEKVTPSYLSNLGQFTLYQSTMKLKMSLLHEGDILTLLDGLQEQTAPFIVKECELVRPVGAKINPKILASNIESTCDLDWLTLRDPELRTPS
jgi:hypothetical protein